MFRHLPLIERNCREIYPRYGSSESVINILMCWTPFREPAQDVHHRAGHHDKCSFVYLCLLFVFVVIGGQNQEPSSSSSSVQPRAALDIRSMYVRMSNIVMTITFSVYTDDNDQPQHLRLMGFSRPSDVIRKTRWLIKSPLVHFFSQRQINYSLMSKYWHNLHI